MAGSKDPIFSILLPTHNRADVLPYAIESVLLQTEPSFELLVVGDGCTDNTEEVVKRYLKDKRVKWFPLPKARGFGYTNRNVALKAARGKYIAYAAHDDILLPDHLHTMRRHLDESPNIDIVYSRPVWVSRDGHITPSAFNLKDKKSLEHFLHVGNAIPATCFVYRRSCFQDGEDHWDSTIERSGDWDLWKRIMRMRKNNWVFEPAPTSLHFVASWKEERLWFSHDYAALLMKQHQLYPPELHIPIKSGQTEQAVFWSKIKKDPFGWAHKVRESCFTWLDSGSHHLIPTLYEARKTIERLQADLAAKNAAPAQMQKHGSPLTDSVLKKLIKIIKPGTRRYVSRIAKAAAKYRNR